MFTEPLKTCLHGKMDNPPEDKAALPSGQKAGQAEEALAVLIAFRYLLQSYGRKKALKYLVKDNYPLLLGLLDKEDQVELQDMLGEFTSRYYRIMFGMLALLYFLLGLKSIQALAYSIGIGATYYSLGRLRRKGLKEEALNGRGAKAKLFKLLGKYGIWGVILAPYVVYLLQQKDLLSTGLIAAYSAATLLVYNKIWGYGSEFLGELNRRAFRKLPTSIKKLYWRAYNALFSYVDLGSIVIDYFKEYGDSAVRRKPSKTEVIKKGTQILEFIKATGHFNKETIEKVKDMLPSLLLFIPEDMPPEFTPSAKGSLSYKTVGKIENGKLKVNQAYTNYLLENLNPEDKEKLAAFLTARGADPLTAKYALGLTENRYLSELELKIDSKIQQLKHELKTIINFYIAKKCENREYPAITDKEGKTTLIDPKIYVIRDKGWVSEGILAKELTRLLKIKENTPKPTNRQTPDKAQTAPKPRRGGTA